MKEEGSVRTYSDFRICPIDTNMARYDLDLFQGHHRWHYRILKMEAEAGPYPATVAYDSRTDHREGYASQSAARHMALAHKAKLVSMWVRVHPATE